MLCRDWPRGAAAGCGLLSWGGCSPVWMRPKSQAPQHPFSRPGARRPRVGPELKECHVEPSDAVLP